MQRTKFLRPVLLIPVLIGILSLVLSPQIYAQSLVSTLSLRIGPSISFPFNIELPSGSQIEVVQRRDDWLLIKDLRGASGWALITAVEIAGGLNEKHSWRLKEDRHPITRRVSGQVFSGASYQGWGVAWVEPIHKYELTTEYQRSNSYERQWQSAAVSITAKRSLKHNVFYRYGFGFGYSIENKESHVLSKIGRSNNTAYWGGVVGFGYKMNKKLDVGLQARYLLADIEGLNSNYQVSLYWAIGI